MLCNKKSYLENIAPLTIRQFPDFRLTALDIRRTLRENPSFTTLSALSWQTFIHEGQLDIMLFPKAEKIRKLFIAGKYKINFETIFIQKKSCLIVVFRDSQDNLIYVTDNTSKELTWHYKLQKEYLPQFKETGSKIILDFRRGTKAYASNLSELISASQELSLNINDLPLLFRFSHEGGQLQQNFWPHQSNCVASLPKGVYTIEFELLEQKQLLVFKDSQQEIVLVTDNNNLKVTTEYLAHHLKNFPSKKLVYQLNPSRLKNLSSLSFFYKAFKYFNLPFKDSPLSFSFYHRGGSLNAILFPFSHISSYVLPEGKYLISFDEYTHNGNTETILVFHHALNKILYVTDAQYNDLTRLYVWDRQLSQPVKEFMHKFNTPGLIQKSLSQELRATP